MNVSLTKKVVVVAQAVKEHIRVVIRQVQATHESESAVGQERTLILVDVPYNR